VNRWKYFTGKEYKPSGWLKRQLQLQAKGLSGNLDKVWRDVRDSAWIGGDAEGWERVPYWLDGFVPMAYLLEDQDMIARAKKYIDAILAARQPDGWLCPCREEERPEYDTWALQLLSKVLTVYYECSGDERIPGILYDAMKNYHDLLKKGTITLFRWGKYRWYESFVALQFLWDRYGEDWIRELAGLLKAQGYDYRQAVCKWGRPINEWTFETHIVNIAMMLKSEAVSCDLLGEEYTDLAEELRSILEANHGTAVGTFTGDECLSGLSPIQGTELCAVVEQMYSYEWLYAYTGDAKWAERLEKIAFNALPAAISDDMWAHQYDQQSNQISCERFPGKSLFRTNSADAHLFGLEPNYGCCTANFNQGWPKFALSAFAYHQDQVINIIPLPSELTTQDYHITLETDYPFKHSFVYTIDARKAFRFTIRIPSFAEHLQINGKTLGEAADGINTEILPNELTIPITAGMGQKLKISYQVSPRYAERPHDLYSVEYGSLVFSLPIRYEKKMYEYTSKEVERKFPYCDYEYIGKSPWNRGYCMEELLVYPGKVDEVPFSSQNPPVVIKTRMAPVAWEYEDGYRSVCAKLPASRQAIGAAEITELYPYGCAKLRMTELPGLSEKK